MRPKNKKKKAKEEEEEEKRQHVCALRAKSLFGCVSASEIAIYLEVNEQ